MINALVSGGVKDMNIDTFIKPTIIILLLCLSFPLHAAVIHVPDDYDTIQGALDAAVSGDTVLVASGHYYEQLSWPETLQIHLRTEEQAQISGTYTRRPLTIQGLATAGAIVEGFVIANGLSNQGGGLLVNNTADIRITGCRFLENHCSGSDTTGGGAVVISSSDVIFLDCQFIRNECVDYPSEGGGAAVRDSRGVLFESCTFYDNIAGEHEHEGYGGGLHGYGVEVRYCLFRDNFAGHFAGAFFGGTGEFHHNLLIDNWSTSLPTVVDYGGGQFYNNTVTNGSNLFISAALRNNVMMSSSRCSGGSYRYNQLPAPMAGDVIPGPGNIFGEEFLFADDDYHLHVCSVAIDAGDPADPWDEEPEPNGNRINMGRHGNTSEAAPSGCCTPGYPLPTYTPSPTASPEPTSPVTPTHGPTPVVPALSPFATALLLTAFLLLFRQGSRHVKE